jgi:hypothetical protein
MFLTPLFSFLTPLFQYHHECGGKIIDLTTLCGCWRYLYFCGAELPLTARRFNELPFRQLADQGWHVFLLSPDKWAGYVMS